MKLKSVILKHKDEFLELAKKLSFKHQVTDEKKMLVDEKKRLEDSITKIDRYIKRHMKKR